MPRAPKRGDLVDLDAVFDRLLSSSPEKKPVADPYRSKPYTQVREQIVKAIENSRKLQDKVLGQIACVPKIGCVSTELEMVEKLNTALETACEHERALLLQLKEID